MNNIILMKNATTKEFWEKVRCNAEYKEIREIFINNGFDVNTRNDKGWSLLSYGASDFNDK